MSSSIIGRKNARILCRKDNFGLVLLLVLGFMVCMLKTAGSLLCLVGTAVQLELPVAAE